MNMSYLIVWLADWEYILIQAISGTVVDRRIVDF